jgi:hypothetical protein
MCMYLATVDWLTERPNFCSSPWMWRTPERIRNGHLANQDTDVV